ncbi:NfeD family protein [Falsigemmobacter faecalis]|nr:hypothetical protein [Falsigemmobacter faecalis]
MLSAWWLWVLGGLVLAGLELAVPGYFFLGFAAGAVLTGGLAALGIAGTHTALTLVIFALLSAVAWAALRYVFGVAERDVKIIRRDINED